MKSIHVGDGLHVLVVSTIDAELEAQANQAAQVYFGNGFVELAKGDTVLDVGANVGSFARVAALAVGSSGKVVAVEPIPEIYAALADNAKQFKAWSTNRKMDTADIVPVMAGVGDGLDEWKDYYFYPRCSAISTCRPDVPDVLAATFSLVRNTPQPTSYLQRAAGTLACCLPQLYKIIHQVMFPRLFLTGVRRVRCRQRTVPQIMDQLNLRNIALLKVNVERAEMEVLQGLSREHWRQIHQVSIQVHDLPVGRVEAVVELLRKVAAFEDVWVWKEPRFQDCCLVMVCASRLKG